MLLSRRGFGAIVASSVTSATRATAALAPALDVTVTTLGGRRVLVAVPRPRPTNDALRIAVLLHGLGETSDPELGARAFGDRYGLFTCDSRLRTRKVGATGRRADFPEADIGRMNDDLAKAPYRGLVYVCPHMPNVQTAVAAREYGRWLSSGLLPAVRDLGIGERSSPVALAGCSLGGYATLEIASDQASSFAAFAGVQSAFSAPSAGRFASAISKKVYLATSSGDPYRAANEGLSRELARLGKDVTFRSFPGPHDQPWLREVGTLDLLLWLDRALASAAKP